MIEKAKDAKDASILLSSATNEIKNNALQKIALALDSNRESIIAANEVDLIEAEKSEISPALIKRLKFDDEKIEELIAGINDLIKLDDPVNTTIKAMELDQGLELFKVSCPIGVIGVIFESRPDALVQISTLCLKSGNSVLLKGGSEARETNKALFDVIREASEGIPDGWIQLLESREEVKEMLILGEFISLIIPRGSNSFVKYIMDNTTIPVLGHADGICHVYVDSEADLELAQKICFDSKCQYPAVCNAMETLLVHTDVAKEFLPKIKEEYEKAGVELRGDDATLEIIDAKKATEDDWKTEYNDLILSIKIVKNITDAIGHINKYGSGHTDAIVTKSKEKEEEFISKVDSANVFSNCSTRFADGFRYGLGAEVGISTNKVHARGPVGLEGLVIYKWKLIGQGHIVSDYSGKDGKKFTHIEIK